MTDSTTENDSYSDLVLAGTRRLLGALDRDGTSPTAGCFDRDHWAWKFRDFPLTMLQAGAYPLAQLWAAPDDSPYARNDQLLEWVSSALHYTCRQQHPSGGFDSVAPNTRDLGVSLAMAHFVWRSFQCIAAAAPASLEPAVRSMVSRACRFASRTEEDYAFIANHRALFALGFIAGAEASGDSDFAQQAKRFVEEIVERQSPGGSFPEYDGFDPGYETLGISYMARYWKLTGDRTVLDALSRSVGKLAYAVHPDGSVGGQYGSRHTRLYFPAGVELLADHVPEANAIASFMRPRLRHGNVVTPANVDIHNLPVLLASYVEARQARAVESTPAPGPLPCETFHGIRHLDGLTVVGSDRYYAIAAADQGGLLRAFERPSGRSVYEEGGYLVADGRRQWCSAGAPGARLRDEASTWACETPLVERRSEVPTPTKFVILRLLNLTLFRSLWAGRLIRRAIVRRLTTGRRPGPLSLRREIRFDPDRIVVRDRITADRPRSALSVRLPRDLMPYHMGSANYFHESTLADQREADLEELTAGLASRGHGSHELVLSFVPPAKEAITGNVESPAEETP